MLEASSLPALKRLRAVVLLAGSVRVSEFSRLIGRAVLDLPTPNGGTLISRWTEGASRLASVVGRDELAVRVYVDRASTAPVQGRGAPGVALGVRVDRNEYRGTAGVLRDIADEFDPDDYLLVCNGNQVLIDPLDQVACELAASRADVALLAHRGGSPTGVMLLRMGVMRAVREVGFMDFKEQVLAKIAEKHDVRVVYHDEPSGFPVRGLEQYVTAMHALTRAQGGRSAFDDGPWSERWFPTFGIVESGARVGAGARIHDSVVLGGARVGADAVVVRSLVCGDGSVATGSVVCDAIVHAGSRDEDSRKAR